MPRTNLSGTSSARSAPYTTDAERVKVNPKALCETYNLYNEQEAGKAAYLVDLYKTRSVFTAEQITEYACSNGYSKPTGKDIKAGPKAQVGHWNKWARETGAYRHIPCTDDECMYFKSGDAHVICTAGLRKDNKYRMRTAIGHQIYRSSERPVLGAPEEVEKPVEDNSAEDVLSFLPSPPTTPLFTLPAAPAPQAAPQENTLEDLWTSLGLGLQQTSEPAAPVVPEPVQYSDSELWAALGYLPAQPEPIQPQEPADPMVDWLLAGITN